jgi:hypothetical protein
LAWSYSLRGKAGDETPVATFRRARLELARLVFELLNQY